MNDLLLEARHHPAERRVRRFLVEVAAHFGDEIPLRPETIASLAGTTRSTANVFSARSRQAASLSYEGAESSLSMV